MATTVKRLTRDDIKAFRSSLDRRNFFFTWERMLPEIAPKIGDYSSNRTSNPNAVQTSHGRRYLTYQRKVLL